MYGLENFHQLTNQWIYSHTIQQGNGRSPILMKLNKYNLVPRLGKKRDPGKEVTMKQHFPSDLS